MDIHGGIEGLANLPDGAVLSIGNFDGMHRGHLALLGRARELRQQLGASALAVATFEPHPFTVLRPDRVPPRLTPPPIKQALLRQQGVDHLVVLPPEPSVLNLTAEAFFEILRDRTRPAALVEGKNFTFGKGRGGTIDRLRQWVVPTPIHLEVVEAVEVPLLNCCLVPASSSVTRWLLTWGRVRDAAIVLGRPYVLRGQVIQGHQRGRAIGMPTANLAITEQLIPQDGVYAARCTVGGHSHSVALSIGSMPTFGDKLDRQVEAHLLDFDGDLYGQTLEVEVLDWLREQRKYHAVQPLQAQMARDLADVRHRADLDPSRSVVKAGIP